MKHREQTPRWKKWTVVIAIVAISVLIGVLWVAGNSKLRLNRSMGVTIDPTPVSVMVGGEHLTIPRNYLWSSKDTHSEKTNGVNLHALLPSLIPPTKDTVDQFFAPGWGDKITILISAQRMDIPGETSNAASMNPRETFDRFINGTTTPIEFDYGLSKHESPHAIDKEKDVFVGQKEDGAFHWLRCSRRGQVMSPSCTSDIDMSKHLYIQYSFSIDHLRDWKHIDSKVNKLVTGFRNTNKQAPK